MKRFFARNTLIQQQQQQRSAAAALLNQQAARQFASSPQKNPYGSILTKLSVGGNQFSYYKLPALGDKRIGKCEDNIHIFITYYPTRSHSAAVDLLSPLD